MDLAGIPLSAGSIASCIALSVANIDDPSAELGAIAGSVKGELRLCYQTVAGADEWTLYAWDSASSAGASTPYRINGTSGQWQAVAGKYANGSRNFNVGIIVGDGTAAVTLAINGAASTTRSLVFRTNGTNRWVFQTDSVAEGGANAGTGLQLLARQDDGTAIDTVLSIARAAGSTVTCGRQFSASYYLLVNSLAAQITTATQPVIYGTSASGGAYPFLEAGNLIISPRISGAVRDFLVWNTSGGTPTAVFFRSGRVAIGSTTDDGSTTLQVGGSIRTTSTTDASSVSAASAIHDGGLGVAKRSYLGTIASTFAGNVIAGVADATTAAAGQVGEVLSSVVSGVAVATSTSVGNVTSLSLTAGNWLLGAMCVFSGGATGLSSGTTAKLSVVSSTATNGTPGSTMAQQTIHSLVASDLVALSVLRAPIQITGTNSFFLTEELTYAPGSPTASATLWAVRIR